jgi:hypothetical protein
MRSASTLARPWNVLKKTMKNTIAPRQHDLGQQAEAEDHRDAAAPARCAAAS